jgi:hypothetical protein
MFTLIIFMDPSILVPFIVIYINKWCVVLCFLGNFFMSFLYEILYTSNHQKEKGNVGLQVWLPKV